MSLLIDDHRQFLQDRARLDAFARAVSAVVRPGDVVADLASGTGVLGLLACRAGAARVYAIEDTGMSGFAAQAAARAGFADRFIPVRGISMRVDLPERVDAIVSDIIGRIGFLGGGAEALLDARTRWLKPGGVMMPAVVRTWIAPVESAALSQEIEFWRSPIAGFDWSSVREGAANTGYPHAFAPDDLLAPGTPVTACDYRIDDAAMTRGAASFTVTRGGTLHGLAAWFTADLAPEVVLTNAPAAPDRIDRRNAFLPLDQPVVVQPGDRIEVSLVIRPIDFVVSWRTCVRRGDRVLVDAPQSTLRGMLLTRDDLHWAANDHRPVLSRWAGARATVLALCDGRTPLADIEAALVERHRDLFASLHAAQVFAAEVISRYSDTARTE